MTSCGCFECICGIMPEANGVIIVNREFSQTSPVGNDLRQAGLNDRWRCADSGFMGHGRFLIGSKIMSAEGGSSALWMPKRIKRRCRRTLKQSCLFEMTGIENFADMVCDDHCHRFRSGSGIPGKQKHRPGDGSNHGKAFANPFFLKKYKLRR